MNIRGMYFISTAERHRYTAFFKFKFKFEVNSNILSDLFVGQDGRFRAMIGQIACQSSPLWTRLKITLINSILLLII